MNEQKQVVHLLILILPIFALMFVGVYYSPMYQEMKKAEKNMAAIFVATNFYNLPFDQRLLIMEKYDLTPDDVDILTIINKFHDYDALESKSGRVK